MDRTLALIFALPVTLFLLLVGGSIYAHLNPSDLDRGGHQAECLYMTDAECEAVKAERLDLSGDADGTAEVQDLTDGDRIEEDDPEWDCRTMGNRTCSDPDQARASWETDTEGDRP